MQLDVLERQFASFSAASALRSASCQQVQGPAGVVGGMQATSKGVANGTHMNYNIALILSKLRGGRPSLVL